jgi:hypothetical protein
MAKSKRTFAILPGEILKTEFMEPRSLSAYALAKGIGFPGIYAEFGEIGPLALTQRFAWESILDCVLNFGLTFRMITN